ncbi:MAG: pilus assembly protein PilM, partial [Planctomycetota bacterium]|nr:pilus assembly protein PilM [Planctomycetota bacterium]
MAVWGIDIGHTALKAVKLNQRKEGLEIDQVAYIPMEMGDGEDDRPEQVRAAVKTFLARHPIRNERVIVSLPGLHAFSRFIKLPPVEAKKIGEMVVYEAQQQIPFPIDEVMWGHHMIDREYEPGEEIEVGIFAARKELLLGFLSELRDNGVSPDIVTIAPLAIYNFVTYNTNVDDATVILDIGAKHTDLIVVKGANFWIRNLRIAGGDITEALSSRFKIPSHEAEKLKRHGSNSKNA